MRSCEHLDIVGVCPPLQSSMRWLTSLHGTVSGRLYMCRRQA